MKKYLFSLILILFLAICTSWITINLINKWNIIYYPTIQKNEKLFNNEINADIILLGSSRMYNTVNPKILENTLHLNTYNLGTAGANLNEVKMILQAYLSRNKKPLMAVLAVDLFSMDISNAIAFDPIYLNYLHDPYVEIELSKDGMRTTLYKNFPFLKTVEMDDYYKSGGLKMLLGQTEIQKGDFFYNGYLSNTSETIKGEINFYQAKQKIDPEGIIALNTIINICKSSGIKLILTYSPEYNHYGKKNISNHEEIMRIYHENAKENKIPFLRNDSLSMCQDPLLFANTGHVNRTGADVYTSFLATQLRTHLIDN